MGISDLLSHSLAHISKQIRLAVDSGTNPDRLRSALAWVRAQEDKSVLDHSLSCDRQDVSTTTWVRFGLYATDFGYGKPVYCTLPADVWDGAFIILPDGHNTGGVRAFVGLTKANMRWFLLDEELQI